jgi:methyl coenzyme M reductase gamma subunit
MALAPTRHDYGSSREFDTLQDIYDLLDDLRLTLAWPPVSGNVREFIVAEDERLRDLIEKIEGAKFRVELLVATATAADYSYTATQTEFNRIRAQAIEFYVHDLGQSEHELFEIDFYAFALPFRLPVVLDDHPVCMGG